MAKVKFRKGDRVRFRFPTQSVEGFVKEDRGPIGIGGRHLYLVEFHLDPESPSHVELPAVELEAVRGSAVTKLAKAKPQGKLKPLSGRGGIGRRNGLKIR